MQLHSPSSSQSLITDVLQLPFQWLDLAVSITLRLAFSVLHMPPLSNVANGR